MEKEKKIETKCTVGKSLTCLGALIKQVFTEQDMTSSTKCTLNVKDWQEESYSKGFLIHPQERDAMRKLLFFFFFFLHNSQ